MIVTERYQISAKLRNFPLAKPVIDTLFHRVARRIAREPRPQTVISSGEVASMLRGTPGLTAVDAGTLFNLFYSKVDPDELSGLIHEFLAEADRLHGGTAQLFRLKPYFFAMLSDHWCQLVDFARSAKEPITVLGSPSSPESVAFGAPARTSPADFLLRRLAALTARARVREATNVDWLMANFGRVRSLPSFTEKEVVVVNVLEERRFGRLNELLRELSASGLGMVLFCSSPKPETLRGLEKFPELRARLLTGAALLDPAEARDLFLRSQSSLRELCDRIRSEGLARKFTYHGSPLLEAAWGEVEQIFLQRGPELAINSELVERTLARFPVKAFLGVDTGTATSAWIDTANRRGIPTFFHFYNALKSILSYRLLWECLSPTTWALGSPRQERFFRESGAPATQKFFVSGDMFADTIVRCDRAAISAAIRAKAGLSAGEKVVLLLSAYVIADFTLEVKRRLFQSVAKAASEIGARLVVKAHPNERLELLRDQMKEWGIEAPVFHHESIRDMLLASDLACMYASEAGQQAMLAGVPVIALLPDTIRREMDQHFDYFSTGAVAYLPLGDDVAPLMRSLIFDEGARLRQIELGYSHAEATLGRRDGRNAERLASIVRGALS